MDNKKAPNMGVVANMKVANQTTPEMYSTKEKTNYSSSPKDSMMDIGRMNRTSRG